MPWSVADLFLFLQRGAGRATEPGLHRLLNALVGWLHDVPIDDPVDRRNAVAFQGLLLFLLATIPTLWIYHLTSLGMPRGGVLNVVLAAMTTVAIGISLAMIRAGRFRPAVVLYLAMLLAATWVNYAKSGFQTMSIGQSDQFLALVLGGLVLGRRALWTICLALLGIVLTGCLVDYPARGGRAFENAPSISLAYLIVTIMLDRTVTALREALHSSDTRRRELQYEMAARERAQSQLAHARKVELTGRMASGFAHDFNTVLSVILGYAIRRERLADRGAPALVDALAGVEREARRAVAINRNLLDFSRREALHAEIFDVGAALEEMRTMLQHLLRSGTTLRIDAPPDRALAVRMDRAQFVLVILNIAANARDAMPDGGIFSIVLRAIAREGQDWVEIALSDTGPGIPDAVRPHLFEPFHTTKPAGSGTGLGLSLARDMLHSAGGVIAADPSAAGAGACFRIVLPSAGDAAARAQPANT